MDVKCALISGRPSHLPAVDVVALGTRGARPRLRHQNCSDTALLGRQAEQHVTTDHRADTRIYRLQLGTRGGYDFNDFGLRAQLELDVNGRGLQDLNLYLTECGGTETFPRALQGIYTRVGSGK